MWCGFSNSMLTCLLRQCLHLLGKKYTVHCALKVKICYHRIEEYLEVLIVIRAWWNRCKTDLNSFPSRKLDETTGTSSYCMDENHSAGSEIQRPQYGRRSWLGSEPSTLEVDVYVRCYALLVVLARNNDDDDDLPGKLFQKNRGLTSKTTQVKLEQSQEINQNYEDLRKKQLSTNCKKKWRVTCTKLAKTYHASSLADLGKHQKAKHRK